MPSPVEPIVKRRYERIPILGNPKTGLPRVKTN
jgi:hypothetical protein